MPPAPEPRLTVEQQTLFVAASDPYFFDGKWVDPGEARAPVLARFRQHSDPRCAQIADAVTDLLMWSGPASELAGDAAKGMDDLTIKWRRFVRDSALEGIGFGEVDVVDRTQDMVTPLQEQAIKQRRMELLGANLALVVRTHAAGIASEGDAGRREVAGAMDLALKRDGDLVYMRVLNRTSRVLHNCVITARRVQGAPKNQDGDAAAAAAIMALAGANSKAIATNHEQAVLLQKVQHTEHGAFVFLPLLPSGKAVSFLVAPASHFEFTEAVEASLWCDEGQERNRTVDLPAFYRATYEETQRRQARQPGSPSNSSKPFAGSGSSGAQRGENGSGLGGASSLNGAKGL